MVSMVLLIQRSEFGANRLIRTAVALRLTLQATVAFINYGDDYGKLVVIVDMVDMNRVLVDGLGHFPRVMYPLRRLTLTRLRIPILRGARTGTLKKAAAKFELDKKWADTRACQKLERAKTRAATTDFDRF